MGKGRKKNRALVVIRKQIDRARHTAEKLETKAPRNVGRKAAASRHALAKTIRSILREAKTSSSAINALRKINAIVKSQVSKSEAKRVNTVFKQQARLAQLGQPSSFGSAGKAKIKILYRATQRYWQGRDIKQRNENIMKALGVHTMDEAMAIVMAQNQGALQSAIDSGVDVNTTNDSSFINSVIDEIGGSPDYINLVEFV